MVLHFCLLFVGFYLRPWTFGDCEVLPLHRKRELYFICARNGETNSILLCDFICICKSVFIDIIHFSIERL